MEVKDIAKKIEGLGEQVEQHVKAAETAINKKTGEQIEGVKSALSGEIQKANEQAEIAIKKANETDTLVTEAKNLAQQTQVKLDELDKKLSTSRIFQKEVEQKSFNDGLKEAIEEKTDDLQKFIRKETKGFSLDLKTVGDITTANVTGGTLYGQLMRPGIIEAPKRKVHVRSLLPGGNIGPGNSFTYMRENGDGEGAIAPTAETGTKPQIDVDLIEATVQVETIAGWLRVTRKAMNNIPGFISFLQSRLPEKLLRIEDYQIIYGDGNTPNLKGILHADNSVDSTSTASVLVEAIIDDISLLEDTYERSATGIVMRPADYYSFFKNKAEGSGEYDLPQGVVFINGVLYILGIPVAPTTALTAGDYVVGDFQQGAQLLIQEGMRIEFFEQDSDNVTKNKVTVRIEESVALPVYGGDYFIKGAVPAQAT
jgi:HK97 family phage major capsid protein